MNPEKYGINIGLKNMSDLMFCKEHAQCDFKKFKICCLKVHVLTNM